MTQKLDPSIACRCGSQIALSDCCLRFIDGEHPPTAEALMRSRYTAFCLDKPDYLLATDRTGKINRREDYQQAEPSASWLGLKIIKTHLGMANDQFGSVEFVAFYQDHQTKSLRQIHEVSSFSKIDCVWFYTEGRELPDLKIGRNDVCFCASRKKYKKCHALTPDKS